MAQPGTTTKAGGWAKRSAERLRAKSSGRSVLFIATRVKSEGRRSKAEGRNPNHPRPRVSVFGFRNSAFFRPSAFGLRTSKLLHSSPQPSPPEEQRGKHSHIVRDVAIRAQPRHRAFSRCNSAAVC